jgi:hypothetical protein
VNINTIHRLVRARHYQIKLHAFQHALQEGFGEKEMIAAVLTGTIIEAYPDRNRVLICGKAMFDANMEMYLHIVCEQNYPDQVEFITAYIPSMNEWSTPPLRRKKSQ